MPDPSISRKRFLKQGSAALAAAGLATVGCQPSNKPASGPTILTKQAFEWDMVTTWPPNFPILGEGCQQLADWIEQMSGGRLKVKVYGAGKLVPALESFEAVSLGAVAMAHGASYYWAGKIPAAQFFSTVPFGMNAQQMMAWLIAGGGQELWDEAYEPFGLIGRPAGNTGIQMGGWFNTEINTVADLKGLKMRIPGLGGKVMSKAGVTAVNVAGGEIYTNLERGVIDATEWIGPFHDYKMGFHEIAKYYYYPGWHEPGTVLETLVNRKKLEELPTDLQEIVKTAIARQGVWIHSMAEAANSEYLLKIQNETSVEMRAFPTEVLEVLRTATGEVLEEMIASDPLSAKVYASYRKFQQQVSRWANYTEKRYYSDLQK
ncbi:MAG: TRAP transporter substrate-binding protein [Bacteroidota bacterium]